MRVTVNDTELQVDDGTTIATLLERLGYPYTGIAVAVNWAVLPRSQWDSPVPADAQVEVVTAVQGG
ncbi:MAG: sulfur carrier protein ThiS [Mycobacterium sp.]|nr:sulfur carrier protein ThiS [Mycobacterium sp.]